MKIGEIELRDLSSGALRDIVAECHRILAARKAQVAAQSGSTAE